MKFVQFVHVPEVLQEPVAESINLIPFLFVIFVFIEIFENYFTEKIEKLALGSRLYGPLIGSLLASIPQCGFSVIATMLYLKRFISLGTLIAVYLATSDEAIPILLVYPESFPMILPVVATKIVIGIFCGYAIDLIFKPNLKIDEHDEEEELCEHECGCCGDKIQSPITNLFLHPVKHTFNIFVFILIVNCALGLAMHYTEGTLNAIFSVNSFVQVFIASTVGLIPNCAASVLVVMLFLKHVIGFGSLIAGLSTNAGLGLLVLFKHNESIKDSFKIVGILFAISIVAGLILQLI